ncbi:MAG: hypothetical protein L0Z53_00200 [Acidobacteriales bacterium]|nr:hypothetical protein [Terriglobales bacterium]
MASLIAAQEQPATLEPIPVVPPVYELKPGPDRRVPEHQVKELLRTVIEKDGQNYKKRQDYTYLQRRQEDKLDGDGKVKSTQVLTSEVLIIYGEQVERLIAKDGQPLSEKDAAKEEERIQKIIDKRKNESEGEREKRLKKEEKRREQGRSFVQEIADAYTFQLVGSEQLDGRDTYVIDAEPRPGYKPKLKEAKILPKFRFRAWINKADLQWIKLDAVCIDTVSFGLFLARIHKGTRVVIEQTQVNEEVWLPKHVMAKIEARVALLKKYNVNQDYTFSDYRKFRTDTKIVGVEKVRQ